jgi:hypothetical protein
MIDKTLGIGAADEYLAHVAHVEDATLLADGLMLVDDIRILYGHDKTAKGRHQRTLSYVFVVKTGLFACLFHSL